MRDQPRLPAATTPPRLSRNRPNESHTISNPVALLHTASSHFTTTVQFTLNRPIYGSCPTALNHPVTVIVPFCYPSQTLRKRASDWDKTRSPYDSPRGGNRNRANASQPPPPPPIPIPPGTLASSSFYAPGETDGGAETAARARMLAGTGFYPRREAGRKTENSATGARKKKWNFSTQVENLSPDGLLYKHPGWDAPWALMRTSAVEQDSGGAGGGGRPGDGVHQGEGLLLGVRKGRGFFDGGSSARTITTRESGSDCSARNAYK